jgi:hypothetical protein
MEREEMRPFVYAELTSLVPGGREYSLGKGIPLNGSVLSENGCCTCSIPRKVLVSPRPLQLHILAPF